MCTFVESVRQTVFPNTLLKMSIAGVLMLGIVLAPPSVSAAIDEDPPTLIKNLRTELNSKDLMRRDLALVDIVVLGRCPASCTVSLASGQGKQIRFENDSDVGTVIDLDALIPDLMKVYRSGPADGHRLMALAALVNIGNHEALTQLVEESPLQSADVKRATNRTLAAFYLEQYPELMERTLRTKTLTIEDVDRAEQVRIKVARDEAKMQVEG